MKETADDRKARGKKPPAGASDEEQVAVFDAALRLFGISVSDPNQDGLLLRALFADKELLHALAMIVERRLRREGMRNSRRTRGPKAKQTPLKKRSLARRFRKYREGKRSKLSVSFSLKGFSKSLPPALIERANTDRDGRKTISLGRLRNLIDEGERLIDQGSLRRQLKAAWRNHPTAFARRQQFERRRAALNGKIPTKELLKEIEFTILSKEMGTGALLGDHAPGSMFIFPKK